MDCSSPSFFLCRSSWVNDGGNVRFSLACAPVSCSFPRLEDGNACLLNLLIAPPLPFFSGAGLQRLFLFLRPPRYRGVLLFDFVKSFDKFGRGIPFFFPSFFDKTVKAPLSFGAGVERGNSFFSIRPLRFSLAPPPVGTQGGAFLSKHFNPPLPFQPCFGQAFPFSLRMPLAFFGPTGCCTSKKVALASRVQPWRGAEKEPASSLLIPAKAGEKFFLKCL